MDVLVERLRDKRAEVRSTAARALGELGDPAAAGPLKAAFLGGEGVPIGVANDALSHLGSAGGEAFQEGLRSPEATVRRDLTRVLGWGLLECIWYHPLLAVWRTSGTIKLVLGRRPGWGEIPREALEEAPSGALTPLTR